MCKKPKIARTITAAALPLCLEDWTGGAGVQGGTLTLLNWDRLPKWGSH